MLILRIPFVAVLTALLLSSCSDKPDSTPDQRPGSPKVYQQIADSSSCDELQKIFDTANDGPPRPWRTDYMKAADARMQEIGCYN